MIFNRGSSKRHLIPYDIDTGTLQIFSGRFNKDYTYTCSAAVPVFRLLKQEMVYDPEAYDQQLLPDLFDIVVEAILSPTRNNVTLYINHWEPTAPIM